MTRPKFELGDFRKAHRSDPPDKDCVHCARGLGWVIIRDTKQEFDSNTDHKFGFPVDAFDAFQQAIRDADLRTTNIPAGVLDGLCISIERPAENVNLFRSTIPQEDLAADTVLIYTDREIAAFFDGVHNHEFDTDGVHVAHTAECAENCQKRELVAAIAL